MPTKNIYIKEEDLPLVERAEAELGQSLSSVFADCLREKLGPLRPTKVKRIKIRAGNPPITKVFEGRWLVEDITLENDDDGVRRSAKTRLSAAQTKQGRIVVHEYTEDEDNEAIMEVYDTFEDFKTATFDIGYPSYPQNFIAAVADALDVPFEVELDI